MLCSKKVKIKCCVVEKYTPPSPFTLLPIVHSPLAFYLDRDVKGIEGSKFKFVTRRKRRDETKKSKQERLTDHGAASAVNGSCLVQRPQSILFFFVKGRTTRVVHDGLSVSVCRLSFHLHNNNVLIYTCGFALQNRYSILFVSVSAQRDLTV